MNQKQMAKALSKATNLGPTQADDVIEKVLDIIGGALQRGEEVNLSGFGKFSVKTRPAREGIDPRDPSKKYPQPERTLAKFKPGKNLKQSLIGITGASKKQTEE